MAGSAAWTALAAHYEKMAGEQMRDLFANDESRFSNFSTSFDDILLDFSKNMCDAAPLRLA